MLAARRRTTLAVVLLAGTLGAGALLAESTVATGRLVAAPGAEQALKAPVSGTLDRFVVTAGERVAEGALLATYDTRALEKELANARERYARLAEQRRADGASTGPSSSGTGPNKGAPSGGGTISRSPELEALDDVVSTQERIARARLVAPEDGWIVRPLVSTGGKIKKRTPLLLFLPVAGVTLVAEAPAGASSAFQPGQRVVVRSAEGGDGEVDGTVAPTGAPGPGNGGHRFAVRLAAPPPFALDETLGVVPRSSP